MDEISTRKRLSIDLEPYPDVREMLESAMESTGETQTSIVVAALRRRLPEIVKLISEERAKKTKHFLEKYNKTVEDAENSETILRHEILQRQNKLDALIKFNSASPSRSGKLLKKAAPPKG